MGPAALPSPLSVAPARDERLDAFASEEPSTPPSPEAVGLDAFAPEHEIRFKTHRPAAASGPSFLMIAVAATVVVGILGLTYTALRRPRIAATAGVSGAAAPAAVATGLAQFESRPSGADVLIDGTARGRTPLKLSLPVGNHTLEIRGESGSRSLPLTIDAGVLVSQYVELSAADVNSGRLDITSDPPGAQVSLDGTPKGVTPLVLDAVEARDHTVTLTRGSNTVQRKVRVAAGATASVFASLGGTSATPGAVGGYIALSVPFEVQVLEDGRLLGTSSSERLMVPTGRHQLELVNTALQYRSSVSVNIEPGRTASPAVTIPDGILSVNALPWADVTIDGRAVGQTPLANLSVPIGSHEVVWRHPQLGERRQRVTVTAQTPARVGMNLAQ